MRRAFIAASAALLISACNGTDGSPAPLPSLIPTAPPPPAVVRPSGTVAGVVYEITATGVLPIKGAHVYWSEYKGVDTDDNGYYSLSDVSSGVQPLWVGKDGYEVAVEVAHPFGQSWIDVLVDGDTRFDIRLIRR